MKFSTLLLSSLAFFACFSVQADTKSSSNVPLDQSHNVFFDQLSSNTFSQQLLQTKNQFKTQDLAFGGSFQIDLQHWKGDIINTTPPENYRDGDGLYLTQATLDGMANLNSWSTVYISIADAHVGQNEQGANDVFFQHAFLLLGNLDKTPVYLTLGVNSLPFGVFTGSGAWNIPLTGAYFNPTQSPQISLGFFKNNLNLLATGFLDTTNHDRNFLISFFYNNTLGNFNYSLGAGYLSDLKTNNVGNSFTRAPKRKFATGMDMGEVWDANASVGYGLVTLYGEIDRGSMKLGENEGMPRSYALTLTYVPKIFEKDTTFGLSYSRSLDFKNVPAPLSGKDQLPLTASGFKNDWAVGVSRSIFIKNLVLGLDLEKQITYANEHSYTGTLDLMVYW